MTHQIDLARGGDRRDVIHQIVESLVGGGIVRLNSESGDDLLALATHADATKRLAAQQLNACSALIVPNIESVTDFVPQVSRRVLRLIQRTTTPLHLTFADGVDEQLIEELPPEATRLGRPREGLCIAVPVSDIIREVLRLLPGPAIVIEPEGALEVEHADLEVIDATANQHSPATAIRFQSDQWTLATEGGLSEEEVAQMMAERIVFVCTGNTCRSPMAEGLFRKLLAERLSCTPEALPQHGFDVLSAGVAAMIGAPASPESVAICEDHGVDLRSHASQPLQLTLLESSDRLYTMTAGHREAIQYRFPEYAERVQLLSRNGRDVTDPIGLGQAAYEQCFDEITENLLALVDELTAPEI